MGYIHTDVYTKQTPKYKDSPCGDVVSVYRDDISTTIVLSDGLQSGLKANIYANLCTSRIISLIKSGMSQQKTFNSVAETMNKAWGKDEPFATFIIARILSNGIANVLSYEMPPAVLVGKRFASVLQDRVYNWEKAMIYEANCTLDKNEGLLLVCDGITQAGLGQGLTNGWEIEGVANYLNRHLAYKEEKGQKITEMVHAKARDLWKKTKGDDCSVVFAHNRLGVTVNILSGPPSDKNSDSAFIEEFICSEGIKIVCGGSTSKMLARELKTHVEIEEHTSLITPPKYRIQGITLATEGIITLNQVYNLLDENMDEFTQNDSPVLELLYYLKNADKIVFWVGDAEKIEARNVEFLQQGIINRHAIIKFIADKLIAEHKLVLIKTA